MLETEPVPLALTRLWGEACQVRMLRCCTAYQLSSTFVEHCLPPLGTNPFFPPSILCSSIVMVRFAQHTVFFPPVDFSLISPFFLLPSFCFFPAVCERRLLRNCVSLPLIKSLAGASATVILEMTLPVWSWQWAEVLRQGLLLGMQECSPAEQDRGTHEEPAAGAVSTLGASQLGCLSCVLVKSSGRNG